MRKKYPFSPAWLDVVPEPLAELFRGLEQRLLVEICSRLKAANQLNEVTVESIRALRAQGIPLEDIAEAITKTADIAAEQLDELFDDVVTRNASYYSSLATAANVTMPDVVMAPADLDVIRRQTKDEFYNITGSLGFVVRQRGRTVEMMRPVQAYRWALDQAELAVLSGAVSYDEAIRTGVRALADSGLRTVTYSKDGKVRYDHADVAVRRAVMTGVNQTCQQYAEQARQRLGTDMVEVTAHKGARNIGTGPENHAAWQGKVYRVGVDFERVTGFGTVQGLGGANCRHQYHPFVEGVSQRTWTDERLASIDNPPFEYDGVTYDQYAASQRQREIERTVRKLKRQETAAKAAGLKDDASAARAKRLRLQKEYTKFSAAADLPTQSDRMRVLKE